MYTCQGILHPGAPDGGCLIHLADCLLGFSRCYWLDRKVEVVKNLNQWETKYERGGCGLGDPCCPRRDPGELFSISKNFQEDQLEDYSVNIIQLSPFVQIPTAVLSIPGLLLKSLLYCADDKAASYSKLAQSYLLLEELQAREKILENQKATILKTMQNLLSSSSNFSKLTSVNPAIESGNYPDELDSPQKILLEDPLSQLMAILESNKRFLENKSISDERAEALAAYYKTIEIELQNLKKQISNLEISIKAAQQDYDSFLA